MVCDRLGSANSGVVIAGSSVYGIRSRWQERGGVRDSLRVVGDSKNEAIWRGSMLNTGSAGSDLVPATPRERYI